MLPIYTGFSGSAPGTHIFANNLWLSGLLNRKSGINLNAEIHSKSEDNISLVAPQTEGLNLDRIKTEPLNETSEKQICFIGHSCTWLPTNIKPNITAEIDANAEREIIFLGHSCTWLPKSSSSTLNEPLINQSDKEIETKNMKQEINKDILEASTIKTNYKTKSSPLIQIDRTKMAERIQNTRLLEKNWTMKTESVIDNKPIKKIKNSFSKVVSIMPSQMKNKVLDDNIISKQTNTDMQQPGIDSVIESGNLQKVCKNQTHLKNETNKSYKTDDGYISMSDIPNETDSSNCSKINSNQYQVSLNNTTITTQSNKSNKHMNTDLEKSNTTIEMNTNMNRSINSQPIKIIESTIVMDKLTKKLRIVPTKELLNMTEQKLEKNPIKKNVSLMGQNTSAWIVDEKSVDIISPNTEPSEAKINKNIQNIPTYDKDENMFKVHDKMEKILPLVSERVLENSDNTKSLPVTAYDQPTTEVKITKSAGSDSKNSTNSKSDQTVITDNPKIPKNQKEQFTDNRKSDLNLISNPTDIESASNKYSEKYQLDENEQKISTTHLEYEKNNNSSEKQTYCKKIDIDIKNEINVVENGRITKSKWIENVFKNHDTSSKPVTENISSSNVIFTTSVGNISNTNHSLKMGQKNNESKIMKFSDKEKLDPSNSVNNNELKDENLIERNDQIQCSVSEPIKSENNLVFMGHSCAWIPENFGIIPSPETLVENIEVKEIFQKTNQYSEKVDKQFDFSPENMENKSLIPKKDNKCQIKPDAEKLTENNNRNIIFMGHSCTWMPKDIINSENKFEKDNNNQVKELNILKATKGEKKSLIPLKETTKIKSNETMKHRKIKSKLSSGAIGTKKSETKKSLKKHSTEGQLKIKEFSTEIVDKLKPINSTFNTNPISVEESKLNALPNAPKNNLTDTNKIKSVDTILMKPAAEPNIGYFIFQDLDDAIPGNTKASTTPKLDLKSSDKIKSSYKAKIESIKINSSEQIIQNHIEPVKSITNLGQNASEETEFVLVNDNKNKKQIENLNLVEAKIKPVPPQNNGFILVEDVPKKKVSQIASKQKQITENTNEEKTKLGKETKTNGFILVENVPKKKASQIASKQKELIENTSKEEIKLGKETNTNGFILVENVPEDKISQCSSKQKETIDKSEEVTIKLGKETEPMLMNDRNINIMNKVNKTEPEKRDTLQFQPIESPVVQSNETKNFVKAQANTFKESESKKTRIFVMNDEAFINYKSNLQKSELKNSSQKKDDTNINKNSNRIIKAEKRVKNIEGIRRNSRIPISKLMKKGNDSFKNTGQSVCETIILSSIKKESSNSSGNKIGKLTKRLNSARLNKKDNESVKVCVSDSVNTKIHNSNEKHVVNILKNHKTDSNKISNSTIKNESIGIESISKEKSANTKSKRIKNEEITDTLTENNENIVLSESIAESNITPIEQYQNSRFSQALKKTFNTNDNGTIVLSGMDENLSLNQTEEKNMGNILPNSSSELKSNSIIVKSVEDATPIKEESTIEIPIEEGKPTIVLPTLRSTPIEQYQNSRVSEASKKTFNNNVIGTTVLSSMDENITLNQTEENNLGNILSNSTSELKSDSIIVKSVEDATPIKEEPTIEIPIEEGKPTIVSPILRATPIEQYQNSRVSQASKKTFNNNVNGTTVLSSMDENITLNQTEEKNMGNIVSNLIPIEKDQPTIISSTLRSRIGNRRVKTTKLEKDKKDIEIVNENILLSPLQDVNSTLNQPFDPSAQIKINNDFLTDRAEIKVNSKADNLNGENAMKKLEKHDVHSITSTISTVKKEKSKMEDQSDRENKAHNDKESLIKSTNDIVMTLKPYKVKTSNVQKEKVDSLKMWKTKKINAKAEALKNKQEKMRVISEIATRQNNEPVKIQKNDIKKIGSPNPGIEHPNKIDKIKDVIKSQTLNSDNTEEYKSSFVIDTTIKENLEKTASKLGISKLTTNEKQYSIPDFNGKEKLEIQTPTTSKLVVNSSNNLKLPSTKYEKIEIEDLIKDSQENIGVLQTKFIPQKEEAVSKEKKIEVNEIINKSPLEKYYRPIDLKVKQLQDNLEKEHLKNIQLKIKPIEKTDGIKAENVVDQNTIKEISREFKNILSSTEKLLVKPTSMSDKINKTANEPKQNANNLKPFIDTEELAKSKKRYIPLTFSITKPIEETKPINTNTPIMNKSPLNDPSLNQYKNYFQESPIPAQNNYKDNNINGKTNNNSETLFQQLKNMIKEDLFTYPKETKEEIKLNKKNEPKSKLSVESCAAQPSIDSTIKTESILVQVKELIKEDLFTITDNPKVTEKLLSNKLKIQNTGTDVTATKLNLLPGTKQKDEKNIEEIEVINSEKNLNSTGNVTKLIQTDINKDIENSSKINIIQPSMKQETILAQAKNKLINTTSLKAPKLEKSGIIDHNVSPRNTFAQLENKTDLVDQFKGMGRTAGNMTTLKTPIPKSTTDLSNTTQEHTSGFIDALLFGGTKIPESLSKAESEHITIKKSKENIQMPEVEFKAWGETVSHPPTLMDKFKAFFKPDTSKTQIKSEISNESAQIKLTYDKVSKTQQDSVIKSKNNKWKVETDLSDKYDGNKDILGVTTESLLKLKTENLKSSVTKENSTIESVKDNLTVKSSSNTLNLQKSDNIARNDTNSENNFETEESPSPKSILQKFSKYFKDKSESVTNANTSDKLELNSQSSDAQIMKISLLDHLTNINTEKIKYDNHIQLITESKLKPQNELKMKIEDVQKLPQNIGIETESLIKPSSENIIQYNEINDKTNDEVRNQLFKKPSSNTPSGENIKVESKMSRDDTSKFLEMLGTTKPKESFKDSIKSSSNKVTKPDPNLKQTLQKSEEISKPEIVENANNLKTPNAIKDLNSSLSPSTSLKDVTVENFIVNKNDANHDKKINRPNVIGVENKIVSLSPKKLLSNKTSYTLKARNESFDDDKKKNLILDNNSIPNEKEKYKMIVTSKISPNTSKENLIDEIHQNRKSHANTNQKIYSDCNNKNDSSKIKKSSDDKKSSNNQNDTTTETSIKNQSKSSVVNFTALQQPTTSDKIKPNLQNSSTSGTIPIEMDRYNSFEATPFNKNDIVVKILHSLKLASIKKD